MRGIMMAKDRQMTCSCGAALDSSGVCTRCGKKRPRSGGYRFLHTLLCVIAMLILFCCFGNTAALRRYCASPDLTEQLRAARLSDANVPFSGGNLADYINKYYVSDGNVLTEDVAAAIDGMEIPVMLADKLDAHFALLRGDSDVPVQIAPQELTDMLTRISDSLRESCLLVIEDSDKQQLREAAEPVLGKVNAVSELFGSTKAGRALQRFGVSIGAYILEVILLGLLLWRWCVIRKNSGKDIAGAFKGAGITVMIPAGLLLLAVLIGGIHSFFVKDSVIGIYGVLKALRAPYWFVAVTGAAFAWFLLELCAFIRARKELKTAFPEKNEKAASTKMEAAPAVPVHEMICVKCGRKLDSGMKFCKFCGAKQESVPDPVSLKKEPAAQEKSDGKICISCGKEIAANMRYCKFCGTNQETGGNIADDIMDGTAGLPEVPEDTK